MKFILGTKQAMSQLFDESKGIMVPVTAVTSGPCFVSQIKKSVTDGFSAVQISFGKKKNVPKATAGHTKTIAADRYIKEFRVDSDTSLAPYSVGDIISVRQFTEGDVINVTGTSKGKGFQGVVKRHGFHGSPKSHGHKDQHRMPGSIGATDPGHVFKGTRMAGQTGDKKNTVRGLRVIKIDANTDTMFIKGAVPGSRGSLVIITGEGEMVPEKRKTTIENGTQAQPSKKEDKGSGENKESNILQVNSK